MKLFNLGSTKKKKKHTLSSRTSVVVVVVVAKVAKVATAATVEVVGMDDVEAVGAVAVGVAAAVADSSVLAIPLASSSDSSVPATPVVLKTWLQISHLAGEEHLLHLQVRSVDWLEEFEGSNGEAEDQRLVEVKLVPLDQDSVDSVD